MLCPSDMLFYIWGEPFDFSGGGAILSKENHGPGKIETKNILALKIK